MTETSALRVEDLERPGADWDAFVESQPAARLGHAAAWARILADAYGLEPHFLAARGRDGEIRGVLPLALFRSIRGRGELISLPYLDSAGLLSAGDPAVGSALIEHALDLSRARGLGNPQLRSTTGPAADLPQDPVMDRVNLVLALERDPEAQWQILRAKVRNQVRKAEREGLRLRAGDPSSLLEGFYEVYAVNMRDLGSPVHSKAFFRTVARAFGERARFIVTGDDVRVVGGLLAIRYGQRVTIPWASTLRAERARCPNNQIYWEALRWAVEMGASELDFGRSPIDGGTYRFKKGWGAIDEGLSWRSVAENGSETPVLAGGGSPMLRRISQLWTRLPVAIANPLGARLRRYLAN